MNSPAKSNIIKKKYKLYNILSGELWEITSTREDLLKLCHLLVNIKNSERKIRTDAEFMEMLK
jgi:predicted component of viral defense system (DUF524 family)